MISQNMDSFFQHILIAQFFSCKIFFNRPIIINFYRSWMCPFLFNILSKLWKPLIEVTLCIWPMLYAELFKYSYLHIKVARKHENKIVYANKKRFIVFMRVLSHKYFHSVIFLVAQQWIMVLHMRITSLEFIVTAVSHDYWPQVCPNVAY